MNLEGQLTQKISGNIGTWEVGHNAQIKLIRGGTN